jgi:hypothetical protein
MLLSATFWEWLIMFLKTSEQTILRSRNLCILLCFFALIAVCAVFAEESSPRKVTSTEVMPIDSMATTKDFETKLTAPCEDLHNAATSEEFRAVTLEATAKESRSISQKAKNEYLTLQQQPRLRRALRERLGPLQMKLVWPMINASGNRDQNRSSRGTGF